VVIGDLRTMENKDAAVPKYSYSSGTAATFAARCGGNSGSGALS
jgi:hypothetical protein